MELTNVSIPDSLSPSIRNRCADNLISIFLHQEGDLKLRTLVIMQSYALLVTSMTAKPFTSTIFQRDVRSINKKKKKEKNNFTLLRPSFSFTVLDKYCAASRFLEELLAQGFSIETPELSAVCLKLLAYIVHCQEKSSIQVEEYVRK